MTTISKQSNFLTLINVFTVDPVNQQKLVDLLTLATESSVRKVKGFISSSLPRTWREYAVQAYGVGVLVINK